MIVLYKDIINFWFKELEPKDWWKSDSNFDSMITKRFGKVHRQAVLGKLGFWRMTAQGRLAEIIILDQFSRNIFRGMSSAFRYDDLALNAALTAIKQKQDELLEPTMRGFLYMPLMHSESKEIHTIAVELFSQPKLEDFYNFELKHKKIIDRFGRYPHRNKLLGRVSTAEEVGFLKTDDSSF